MLRCDKQAMTLLPRLRHLLMLLLLLVVVLLLQHLL